jgi:hypothetical protein
MWRALDVLDAVSDIVDAVYHWRVCVCAAGAFALAFVLNHFFPGYVGNWALVAFPIAGALIGWAWEAQS